MPSHQKVLRARHAPSGNGPSPPPPGPDDGNEKRRLRGGAPSGFMHLNDAESHR